jgi:NitT/TauT family transport system substrate-binding protein
MSHPDQDHRMPRRSAAPPHRGRLLRTTGLGLAAAVFAAGAAGCSGGSSSSLGSPDQAVLRVGLVPDVGSAPFDIATSADEHGFSSAGLTVDVQQFASDAEEMAALKAGSIDIAYGSYAAFLSGSSPLAAAGQLRVLTDAYDAAAGTVGLVVRAGHHVPTPQEIQGGSSRGTIAVPGASTGDSTEFLALSTWLESSGNPIEAPGIGPRNPAIQFVSTPQQALQEVASGQVAGAVVQEPYVTQGEEQNGLREAVDLASGGLASMPLEAYFTTSDFVAKAPRSSALFAAVMAKYQEQASSRVEVETALRSQQGANTEAISTMQLGTYPFVLLATKLDITILQMDNAGIGAQNLNSQTLTDLTTT